jgi:hypothetical protein
VQWTEKHDAEVSRRRKRNRQSTRIAQCDSGLGRRPSNPRMHCACDFNPVRNFRGLWLVHCVTCISCFVL